MAAARLKVISLGGTFSFCRPTELLWVVSFRGSSESDDGWYRRWFGDGLHSVMAVPIVPGRRSDAKGEEHNHHEQDLVLGHPHLKTVSMR